MEMHELRNELLQGMDQVEAPHDIAPILSVPQPIENHVIARPVRAGLFERFRHMRAPEFEGSADPLVADEWLSSLQVILGFMDLTDPEKVKCASFVLKKDAQY